MARSLRYHCWMCAVRISLLWLVALGLGLWDAASEKTAAAMNVVMAASLLFSALEVYFFVHQYIGVHGSKFRKALRPPHTFPLQVCGLYVVQLLLWFCWGSNPIERRPAPLQPEAYPAGPDFELAADPDSLRWTPMTISVILPCAEEREYAVKTVKSVYSSIPEDLLQEIVVVDDGSDPPLEQDYLTPELQVQYRTRVIRHEETIGLIGAKKTGGDAAKGDILVFFDCHVAPQANWYKEFFFLIGENYRRMVVPEITPLDVDTWKEKYGGGLAKCYLTWDADFKWISTKDPFIPIISGGLLGMSKRWWTETGGYDSEMKGWGGENLDQSLRMWLCGGEIMEASSSRVAHMWRDGTRKTDARYKHVGDTNKNRARAVHAWYGNFSKKLHDYGQKFDRPLGNMIGYDLVREQLQGCRPFAWFLRRFKHIYEDGGLLPEKIFMLRHTASGLCLRFSGIVGTASTGRSRAELRPCEQTDDRFFWHTANWDHSGRCCSGLRAWNTDQCITGVEKAEVVQTVVCDVSGSQWGQHWRLTANGRLEGRLTCVGTLSPEDPSLVQRPCAMLRGSSDAGPMWVAEASREPLETSLYKTAQQTLLDVS